jgi:glycolate oxidase
MTRSNHELIHAAREKLDRSVWDFISGGSESETTLRRNRMSLDSLALRPRVLQDVSVVDPSTEFLDARLRIPVMLSPIGSLELMTPEGAKAAAVAAAEFGTLAWISSVTQPDFRNVAAASPVAPVYQLYVHGDGAWLKRRLLEVRDAGYRAICLTVDTRCLTFRERTLLTDWTPPYRLDDPEDAFQAALTLETILACKEISGLPLIVKGIATHEDARICVEHGVDVLVVSNHGGRQLDHGQGTIEILPEVVAAVEGRAKIVLDGGILRGTDVIKAMALGASATAIGKLQCWALAAGGAAGLCNALENLEREILICMRLMGVTRLADLSPRFICPAAPTNQPSELSSFWHLPSFVVR